MGYTSQDQGVRPRYMEGSGQDVSLLEELGIHIEDFTWEKLALCQGMERNLFFDDYESDQEIAKQVDEICLHCPVFKQCYEKGKNGQRGVWGAVYWNGAGKEDSTQSGHKTEEVRRRIEERLAE